MPAKVMNGARAILGLVDPNSGAAGNVGVFNNVSYGLAYSAEPIYILGRYSPDEIVYTAQEAVTIQASGWRVIDEGPHVTMGMPTLSQLLNHEYLTLTILDRQTNKTIAKIHSVRPISYSTSISNRQVEEVSVTFMGLLVDDETKVNAELPTATTLP